MSLRDLLDGECGANPVLKVASHFTTSDIGLGHSSSHFLGRQDGQHLPPTTFKMESLLQEIHAMGGRPQMGPGVAKLATSHPEWIQEFVTTEGQHEQHEQSVEDQSSWVADYMAKDPQLDSIWELHKPPSNFVTQGQFHVPFSNVHYQPTARDLLDDAKWTDTIDIAIDDQPIEKTELMSTASEFLKSVSDPKIKASEFMAYVEKLSTGELAPDGSSTATTSERWANEFEDRQKKEDFWQKLNSEWEKLATDDTITHPWLAHPSPKFLEPYAFAEENAFKESPNPLEEGKRKLAQGDIPAAVLLFEAAAQQDSANAEAWLLLGTTQALNEQDPGAISALQKCLELGDGAFSLEALMSLATSMTNEGYHLQACDALKRWLKGHEKYGHLISDEGSGVLKINEYSSLLPQEELERVQKAFIQAARLSQSSNSLDPDVQCGLGVLFNLGQDFDKAADCFEAALNVNPENPLLWNRLGATLANGGKSSEAIAAYRRALELSPGYIRTRYNLGIGCVNLGAYREAADHFLTSLNMQAKSENSSGTMSDCIWASLRTSLHLSNLSHLSHLIDSRDLESLNRELNYSSSN